MEIKEINIKGFKTILSASQDELHQYLFDAVIDIYPKGSVSGGTGYVFAKGDIPVLLVAHMDTVHEKTSLPNDIYYDPESSVMWSPQGIGGDDRCGIFSILNILGRTRLRPSVLFTRDEEVGCLGAINASSEMKSSEYDGIKFIIELDRHNTDDCVFYGCTNSKFFDYIEGFGFVKTNGSCSDISKICPKWDIAGVNLSIGYFNEHRTSETVNVNAMINTVNRVIKILQDVKDNPNMEGFDYGKPYSYKSYFRVSDNSNDKNTDEYSKYFKI